MHFVYSSGGIRSVVLAWTILKSSTLTVDEKRSLVTVIGRSRNELVKPTLYGVQQSLDGTNKGKFPFSDKGLQSYKKLPVTVKTIMLSAITNAENGSYSAREMNSIYHLMDHLFSEFTIELCTLTTDVMKVLFYRACKPPRVARLIEHSDLPTLEVSGPLARVICTMGAQLKLLHALWPSVLVHAHALGCVFHRSVAFVNCRKLIGRTRNQ